MSANYFSIDELKDLQACEGKVLKKVVYHQWVNKIKPEESFEFLDKLELVFHEGRLVLSGTEDNDAIRTLPDFDIEDSRLRLLHEFGGRIDMRSQEMTHNPLWMMAAGQTLESIELVKEGDLYRNDCLMLNFGEEKLEVRLNVEGLLVEPFELI